MVYDVCCMLNGTESLIPLIRIQISFNTWILNDSMDHITRKLLFLLFLFKNAIARARAHTHTQCHIQHSNTQTQISQYMHISNTEYS